MKRGALIFFLPKIFYQARKPHQIPLRILLRLHFRFVLRRSNDSSRQAGKSINALLFRRHCNTPSGTAIINLAQTYFADDVITSIFFFLLICNTGSFVFISAPDSKELLSKNQSARHSQAQAGIGSSSSSSISFLIANKLVFPCVGCIISFYISCKLFS